MRTGGESRLRRGSERWKAKVKREIRAKGELGDLVLDYSLEEEQEKRSGIHHTALLVMIIIIIAFICCLFLILLLFSGSYRDTFIRSDAFPLTPIIGRLCTDGRTGEATTNCYNKLPPRGINEVEAKTENFMLQRSEPAHSGV